MNKKVLITGAGGFIGRRLVHAFSQEGFSVRAMDISQDFLKDAVSVGAEPVVARLEDKDSIEKVVAGVDMVIAVAAIFDFGVPLPAMKAANVDGVKNLVEAALKHNVEQYIHFSTVGIYGRPAEIPCRVESPKNPGNNYETTKWEGEQLFRAMVKDKPICATTVRPTLVYGPGSRYGHAMFISIMDLLGFKKKKLPLLTSSSSSHHVHVDDVVGAVLHIAKQQDAVNGRIFNIADNKPVSIEEFYRSILDGLDFSAGIQVKIPQLLWNTGIGLFAHLPDFLYSRLNAAIIKRWSHLSIKYNLVPALKPRFDKDWLGYFKGDHIYDTSALSEIGYQFKYPLFSEGVKTVIKWYKENKWLM